MTTASPARARRIRTWSLAAAVVLLAALVLTSCPDLRDGTPGQLFRAEQEAESAARSAALALDLLNRERSTAALASVAVSDARDEVVKAFEMVSGTGVDDATDLTRQSLLTNSMSKIIDQLDTAEATLNHVDTGQSPKSLQQALSASADALATSYR